VACDSSLHVEVLADGPARGDAESGGPWWSVGGIAVVAAARWLPPRQDRVTGRVVQDRARLIGVGGAGKSMNQKSKGFFARLSKADRYCRRIALGGKEDAQARD
jgi:hypothetical protein